MMWGQKINTDMRLLKKFSIWMVFVAVIGSICFGTVSYLKYRHVVALKEARMDELAFSLEFGIGSAIFGLGLSRCDSDPEDISRLRAFFDETKLLDHYKSMKHILSHFDDATLIPPLLLSAIAYQYKEIDGIICLHVTYIEEGLLTEGLIVNFSNNNVFMKDARLYLASQRHKTQPLSLDEILRADFGYTRRVFFFLYIEDQKNRINEFLYPYMREIGCQKWYIAQISDENMKEIQQFHVSVNLVLSDGTLSNSELLKLLPIRISVPKYVDFKDAPGQVQEP